MGGEHGLDAPDARTRRQPRFPSLAPGCRRRPLRFSADAHLGAHHLGPFSSPASPRHTFGTMLPESDLERFVQAQQPVYQSVLAELRSGRKTSHWMWFIFPQLKALGRSTTAR